MKPEQLSIALAGGIKNNFPMLIKGAPGIGKTKLVEAAAETAKADLIVMHPVVDDPVDYKGLPMGHKDDSGEFLADFFPIGALRQLVEAKKKTVCFLDDLGQAPPAVQAACMQLILARKINTVSVSDNVVFIGATNRKEDRAGVTGILEPVKSRFVTILELEPDLDQWIKWAFVNGIPAQMIAFLKFRPTRFHDFKATADITNTPCPRTVEHASWIMTCDDFTPDIQHEMLAGAAGEGFAGELMAFLKVYRNLPDLDLALANPDKVEIPEDPATLYAFTTGIAHKVDPKKNGKNMFALCDRLTPEFSILMVRTATLLKRELVDTSDFSKWVQKDNNREVLIV